MSGSSPLTRGKRLCVRAQEGFKGLIPAHAGKTRFLCGSASGTGAHPRSRGENHAAPASSGHASGSSPLTRGKLQLGPPGRPGLRLIPAHAGKTACEQRSDSCHWAHPRSRGENSGAHKASPGRRGSSPLTRGKHGERGLLWDDPGLIPAHAGKTASGAATRRRGWAHPRSRGENSEVSVLTEGDLGSSPLTRGKRRRRALPVVEAGLIPAHAGKTSGPLSHIR